MTSSLPALLPARLAVCSLCALGFGLALAATPAHAAELAVVASAKSSATPLTTEQAAQVFLGKTSAFADGRKTVLLDLAEGSPVYGEFYNKVTGKDQAQLKAYWSRIVFTGKGLAPKQLPDAGALKKALAADPDAVGYIDKASVDGSVKVLLTVN